MTDNPELRKPLQLHPDLQPELEPLVSELAELKIHGDPDNRLPELWRQIRAVEEKIRQDHAANYPPDPPNQECHLAVIDGFFFQNSSRPYVGDVRSYFNWGHEQLSIWTHTRDSDSGLVSAVAPEVKSELLWRTAGSAIRLTIALSSTLESIHDLPYRWIYRFDPSLGPKEQDWLDPDDSILGFSGGCTYTIRRLFETAPILELLERDEQFYLAASSLVLAADNHWFCQECAIRPVEFRMHASHEPPRWKACGLIPNMEVAVVQATRAVEGILGKPGKNRERAEARWASNLSLPASDAFLDTGKSNLDYYYDLFGLRGEAAHNLGSLPFYLSRQLTIKAQSFAWLVVENYCVTHSVDADEAQARLGFDADLIASEPEDWSTRMTGESKVLFEKAPGRDALEELEEGS